MKNLFILLAVAGALIIGTGCTTAQAVPKSTLNWNPKTGNVEIISPKDTTLKNVVILCGETNGMKFATITIGEYATHMSPEVVEKSAAGTTAMINAGADAGVKYFAIGLQAAAQAAGVPRLPQPQLPKPSEPAPANAP